MNVQRLSLVALSIALPGCFAPNLPSGGTDADATSTGQSGTESTLSSTTGNSSTGTLDDSTASGESTTNDASTSADGESSSTTDDATGTGPLPRAVCGDGNQEGDESCDDGELNGVSGMSDCLDDCTVTTCGDGFLGTPETEECDQGKANADDAACTSMCANAVCGDNLVGPSESCDDGPEGSDTCTAECALASCGDGVVQPPEDCDDENDSNTDACLNTCVFAACGDGFVYPAEEQCDEGPNNAAAPITCAYGTTEGDCTYCEVGSCSTQQGLTTYCGDGEVQEGDGELCDGNYENAVCEDCATGISCNPGFDNCDDSIANGCEIETDNDPDNCGACGNSCGVGGTCSAGVCQTQLLATGGFADIDFYETPDDVGCTASLWYLDTTAGSVSSMCLAGPLVGQPQGIAYTAPSLSGFYQAASGIAPAGERFTYLTYRDNPDLLEAEVGSTATSLGRTSAYTGSETPWGYYANIAATSHVTNAGSSPSALAFHRNSLFTVDSICIDAMDVPTAYPTNGTFAACSGTTPFPATALVPVRFGGSATTNAALFFYANAESSLCLARGNAANIDTGVNTNPIADGGEDDDIESVDLECTDISIFLGGPDVSIDSVGANQGRSANAAGQFFASGSGVDSIRLFESTSAADDLQLEYVGEVAAPAQVEPLTEIFVPRDDSDTSDGDDYIYWYFAQTIYRATKDVDDASVEVLHTVPGGEGELAKVWFYDGFIYYGTNTGIYRRSL